MSRRLSHRPRCVFIHACMCDALRKRSHFVQECSSNNNKHESSHHPLATDQWHACSCGATTRASQVHGSVTAAACAARVPSTTTTHIKYYRTSVCIACSSTHHSAHARPTSRMPRLAAAGTHGQRLCGHACYALHSQRAAVPRPPPSSSHVPSCSNTAFLQAEFSFCHRFC